MDSGTCKASLMASAGAARAASSGGATYPVWSIEGGLGFDGGLGHLEHGHGGSKPSATTRPIENPTTRRPPEALT